MSSGADAEDARDRAGVLDDGDHARPGLNPGRGAGRRRTARRPGSVRLKSRRNLSYTSLTVTVLPSTGTSWSLFGPGFSVISLPSTGRAAFDVLRR